jgi:hypothetical protein
MSTLVAVDGVLYDLESSGEAPDGVSPLVGESSPDADLPEEDPVPSSEPRGDGPPG